jgi:N-acetylglucosaminyldiphosphoundecaprenol N-acetyl-beta-D-mannosaminyltransferase
MNPATASTRANILGVGVDPIDLTIAVERVGAFIDSGSGGYVCAANVYTIVTGRKEGGFRRVVNGAAMVTPDGMPLVWLSRWQGFRATRRVYGPDLLLAACEDSVRRGWRHFFYGGDEGVAELLAHRLTERFPGLAVAGTRTPPFRPQTAEERARDIDRIRDSRADIVWVGLGTPKQERWMAEMVDELPGAVLIGVGAAFDFHAGVKRQAPRWMQRSGLEWLFRLCSEPRRLWRRYLLGNPYFVGLIVLQAIGLRDYPLPDPPVENERVRNGERDGEDDL